MNDVQERLDAGEVLILDGAMGTELQRRGVPMDDVAWDAAALATHPDLVREVHEDYIKAGADVIITNTFATARHVLEPAGMGGQFPS
jgi:S-methylmethionine-dependent homocysteine/selenocysteine methylase